jgi:hypothetical protein
MRSLDSSFGPYLDRLAAFAFTRRVTSVPLATYAGSLGYRESTVRHALERGEMPGSLDDRTRAGIAMVRVPMIDLLGAPDLVHPRDVFMMCLRGGHDPRSFGGNRIERALSTVPTNLRYAPHAEVLRTAAAVHEALLDEAKTRDQRRERKAALRVASLLEGQMAALVQSSGRVADESSGAEHDRPRPGQRYRDVPGRRSETRRRLPRGGRGWNDGREHSFAALPVRDRSRAHVDPAARTQMLKGIRSHVRKLRSHLERIGTAEVSEPRSRRGRRVDPATARQAPLAPRPEVLIHRREEQLTDLYLAVLIDRSGSMAGEEIERAKRFGTLLAEAARGIRGIDGHVCAFDDQTFDILGDFRRHAIGALEAEGGNNDAGALAAAVNLAEASRRSRRLIVMISDGLPTECTLESLRQQIKNATRRGYFCAQVAVSPLPSVVFPHFVDLSSLPLKEAVDRFGELLVSLLRTQMASSRHGTSCNLHRHNAAAASLRKETDLSP